MHNLSAFFAKFNSEDRHNSADLLAKAPGQSCVIYEPVSQRHNSEELVLNAPGQTGSCSTAINRMNNQGCHQELGRRSPNGKDGWDENSDSVAHV